MELVFDHTRRTIKQILRYVNNGEISEESVDYLRYKCEVAINILKIS